MRKISILVIIVIVAGVISFSFQALGKSGSKVLLITREGSSDLDFMIKMEVGVMTKLLTNAGFTVEIATTSGQPMLGRTQKLDKIMKLENINLSNYKGVILACMSAGTFPGVPVSQAEVTVVKKALSEGKPVAANANAANILAEAGVLKGKKFSYWIDPLKTGQYNEKTDPRFAGAIYSGNGVVQDGKIITSGICASMERLSNKEWKDGTAQLTRKFIGELGSK